MAISRPLWVWMIGATGWVEPAIFSPASLATNVRCRCRWWWSTVVVSYHIGVCPPPLGSVVAGTSGAITA
ncbi:hypothetical protein PR002_g1969 [Phytophthora rubi]|uniref:Uncharacterized protein n=1 Tax=Phytophthora rubi TaxID=129364 RepID=A0A6A3NTC9_9STRA|nr:hypothetical protein PR002_g1969 [Phytophthora rubi]